MRILFVLLLLLISFSACEDTKKTSAEKTETIPETEGGTDAPTETNTATKSNDDSSKVISEEATKTVRAWAISIFPYMKTRHCTVQILYTS